VHTLNRCLLAVFVAVLLIALPAFALQSPLSDESVREAYFLGQRHDGSFASLLEKHTKRLRPPKSGPYIASIAFHTPFVQLVQYSDQYIGNYSAQQAQLDHRNHQEFIKVQVQIQLTSTYPAYINDPSGRRVGSSPLLILRPSDFWKDFEVHIFDGEKVLSPSDSHAHANSSCGRRGPCVLAGATLEFDIPASAFTSDTATIEVIPPQGDAVSVRFDLSSLR